MMETVKNLIYEVPSETLIAKAEITTIRFYEPQSFIHFSSSYPQNIMSW